MDFKAQTTPFIIVGDGHNSSSKPPFFQKLRGPFSRLNPNSKKPLALVLTVFMLFALALGVYLIRKPTQLAPQAADDGVTLALKPQTITTAYNQEFSVDVFADTGPTTNFELTAAQVKINYDPNILELKSNVLGNFLPVVLAQPENTNGSTSFIVGSNPTEPKTGSGNLATLTFRVKGQNAPDTQITFDSANTAMTAFGFTTNVARDLTPATVNSSGAQTSPSPSPGTTAPEVSFTLEKSIYIIPPGQEFSVKVLTRSDIDNANLWNATITFPKNLVEVVRFDKTGSFITSWTEEFFSNTTGEISLTGGVTNPGFKTNQNNALMTTIIFKAKALGAANINLIDPSNIYRNSDNAKILQTKRNTTVQIDTPPASPSPSPSAAACNVSCTNSSQCASAKDGCTSCTAGVCKPPASPSPSPSPSRSPSPSPSPSRSPSPSPSPSRGPKGDGNNDGRIDLQDLSVMFSKWSPAVNIISHFQLDFNDDLKINSFDYAQIKTLLLGLGVIRQ